jgi:D-apionolactonase
VVRRVTVATELDRTSWLLLHGDPEPPPERVELRAGPVTCELEGIDLRYVRLGDVEILRRLQSTVRTADWDTIPGTADRLEVEAGDDSFAVELAVRHEHDPIAFSWTGSFTGDSSGRIEAVFDGRAERDITYGRIGLCVLHPLAEMIGRPYRAHTPGGWISGTLPELIGIQGWEDECWVPLFASFDALEVDLGEGLTGRFEFEGDLWETEDHRNWTDASFKTYCTPLSLGGPHHLAAGDTIHNRVTLTVAGAQRSDRPRPRRSPPVSVAIGAPTGTRVPAIGTALGASLSAANADLLRALGPAHVRIDVCTTRPDWGRPLTEMLDFATGTTLEVALHTDASNGGQVEELSGYLAGAAVARVLVMQAGGQISAPDESTPAPLIDMVRRRWRGPLPPLYAGTDHNFGELNRRRPSLDGVDGLFYPVVAEVHAFDDRSLMEEFPAQHDTVVSATAIGSGLPIAISPVTFRTRPEDRLDTGPPFAPAGIDPRQASQFAAAWTIGSVAALARAGAASVTYFEAAGPRGLFPGRYDAPDGFPTPSGPAYPVYGALADAIGLREAPVLQCSIEDDLAVAALATGDGAGRVTILLANLRATDTVVAIDGLGTRSLPPFAAERIELAG